MTEMKELVETLQRENCVLSEDYSKLQEKARRDVEAQRKLNEEALLKQIMEMNENLDAMRAERNALRAKVALFASEKNIVFIVFLSQNESLQKDLTKALRRSAARELQDKHEWDDEKEKLQEEINRKNLSLQSALEAMYPSRDGNNISTSARLHFDLEKHRKLSLSKVHKTYLIALSSSSNAVCAG